MNILKMSLDGINVTILSESADVLAETFTTVLPGSFENEILV